MNCETDFVKASARIVGLEHVGELVDRSLHSLRKLSFASEMLADGSLEVMQVIGNASLVDGDKIQRCSEQLQPTTNGSLCLASCGTPQPGRDVATPSIQLIH